MRFSPQKLNDHFIRIEETTQIDDVIIKRRSVKIDNEKWHGIEIINGSKSDMLLMNDYFSEVEEYIREKFQEYWSFRNKWGKCLT